MTHRQAKGFTEKSHTQQSKGIDDVITRLGRCALPSAAFNATIRNVMTITFAGTSIIFTILLVGVGLAGLILNGQRGFKREFEALRVEVVMLRERMAHLEGLLEGLREAITNRRAA